MPGQRFVTLKEETTFNTIATGMTTPDVVLSFTDLDFNPDQGILYVEESMNRERTGALPGPFTVTGTLSILLRPDTIVQLLKWAFGTHTCVRSGTTAAYVHTYSVNTSVKSFTLCEFRGDLPALECRVITGCIIKKITIEAPAREIVTCEIEILGAKEQLGTTATYSPSGGALALISTKRPMYFADGGVQLKGSTLANVEAFKFVFENTVPDDTHEIGNRFIPEAIIERLSMNGEGDLKFKSYALRKEFYGLNATTMPVKDPNPLSLVFQMDSELISGETAVYNQLKISAPASIITENSSPVKGQDRLTQKMSYEIIYNANTQVTLVNESAYEAT